MFSDRRALALCLRSLSLIAATTALPLAFFYTLGTATLGLFVALLLLLVEQQLRTRKVLADLRSDSAEAIHLTAELAYRVAENDHERNEIKNREEKFRMAFECAAIGM